MMAMGKAGHPLLLCELVLLLIWTCQIFGQPPDLARKGSILMAAHSREYQAGKIHPSASYVMTIHEGITISVPTELAKPAGKWAMYGGTPDKICWLQRLFGVGFKAVFTCPSEGTYFVFFETVSPMNLTQRSDLEDTVARAETQGHFVPEDLPNSEFEQFLRSENVTYSDPIKLIESEFCYQWVYRLEEINAVGFIFDEPDPTGTDGSYRLYNLIVWIGEPAELSEDELFNVRVFDPSPYSMMLTQRFRELGVRPCIRFAHQSIEVISDAAYDLSVFRESEFSKDLLAPHWEFQIKVYHDRTISTLEDITFVVTARQHSALYGCFVADIRVFVPGRKFTFTSISKQQINKINMDNSDLSGLRSTLMRQNALFFFGYPTRYSGNPWYLGRDQPDERTDVKMFSNPCVSQELLLVYNQEIYLTTDWLTQNEFLDIVLPGVLEEEVVFDNDPEHLDREIYAVQDHDLATRLHEGAIYDIRDFAFTPTHLIILRSDSSLYLHPSNVALKGIGYNSVAKKLRLGALVRRVWCASTSTPKSNNEIVPGYSLEGNIVIIFPVPVEGTQSINQDAGITSCAPVEDSTAQGNGVTILQALTEAQIHQDERVEIEASVTQRRETRIQADLRRAEEERRARQQQQADVDLDALRVFWFAGTTLLGGQDPHFSRGATAPANVKVGSDDTFYNHNIIFIIERDFERIEESLISRGLNFDIAQMRIRQSAAEDGVLVRDAYNRHIFSLHAIVFSAVEKTFLAAIEFQSKEFPKYQNNSNTNDLLIYISSITAVDFPSDIRSDIFSEVYLQDVVVAFSGSLLYREELILDPNLRDEAYRVERPISDAFGFPVVPNPNAKRISTLHTINTATPVYVIQAGDISVFASIEGSFARPITYFYDFNPTPTKNGEDMDERRVKPLVRIPNTAEYDTVVSEKGIISILTRVANRSVGAQQALIGSLLTNEPLRTIRPFLSGHSYFQVVVPEGEILYGEVTFTEESLLQGRPQIRHPPFSQFLEIPFWSLLQGSKSRSFGENPFPVFEPEPSDDLKSENIEVNLDEVCPFASFTVDFIDFPFMEAGYRSKITAEIGFYGDAIPLEADILIEFTEVQGLAIVISSNLEIQNDQTIILKSIAVESFMTEQIVNDVYAYFLTHKDDEPVPEFIRVFTMTIRPSVLNLHCNKDDYFRTIQMNIGCVPSTRMRLVGEALPLVKVDLAPFDPTLSRDNLETRWLWDERQDAILAPRDNIHFDQREMFGCRDPTQTTCRISRASVFRDNFYLLSFRDEIVPKFEQFLTRHVRQVTGNVIMYDILGSYTFDEEKARRRGEDFFEDDPEFTPTRMLVNLTQWEAKCIVDDSNWYATLGKKVSAESTTPLHMSTDIYQHFNDCFSQTPSASATNRLLPLDRESPRALSKRSYWVFNHTNRNALRLPRKRNWIYLIRAVVLNTVSNPFTYCQRLETFFALRVANVPAQREPLVWYIYLALTIFVVVSVFLTYFYFSRYYTWRTEALGADKDLYKKEVAFFAERSRLPANELEKNRNPFKRLVRKVQLLARWREMNLKDVDTKGQRPKPASPLDAIPFKKPAPKPITPTSPATTK